jgi:hypothetical protein
MVAGFVRHVEHRDLFGGVGCVAPNAEKLAPVNVHDPHAGEGATFSPRDWRRRDQLSRSPPFRPPKRRFAPRGHLPPQGGKVKNNTRRRIAGQALLRSAVGRAAAAPLSQSGPRPHKGGR